MRILILTPEARVYATALVAVYALGCGSLAGYLQARVRGGPALFLPLYVGLMAAVSALALLVLDLPTVTGALQAQPVTALAVGLAAGIAARWGEAAVRRIVSRRAARVRPPLTRAAGGWVGGRPAGAWRPAGDRPPQLAPPGVPALRAHGVSTAGRYRVLGWWSLAAVLEEVLFRGVLVDLALGLPWPALAGVCLAATAAVFALTHLQLGWGEVLAKLPLAVVTLAAALLLRSVLPAVIAHLWFNLQAWRASAVPVPAGAPRAGQGAAPLLRVP
jgi:hypothetical protein